MTSSIRWWSYASIAVLGICLKVMVLDIKRNYNDKQDLWQLQLIGQLLRKHCEEKSGEISKHLHEKCHSGLYMWRKNSFRIGTLTSVGILVSSSVTSETNLCNCEYKKSTVRAGPELKMITNIIIIIIIIIQERANATLLVIVTNVFNMVGVFKLH